MVHAPGTARQEAQVPLQGAVLKIRRAAAHHVDVQAGPRKRHPIGRQRSFYIQVVDAPQLHTRQNGQTDPGLDRHRGAQNVAAKAVHKPQSARIVQGTPQLHLWVRRRERIAADGPHPRVRILEPQRKCVGQRAPHNRGRTTVHLDVFQRVVLESRGSPIHQVSGRQLAVLHRDRAGPVHRQVPGTVHLVHAPGTAAVEVDGGRAARDGAFGKIDLTPVIHVDVSAGARKRDPCSCEQAINLEVVSGGVDLNFNAGHDRQARSSFYGDVVVQEVGLTQIVPGFVPRNGSAPCAQQQPGFKRLEDRPTSRVGTPFSLHVPLLMMASAPGAVTAAAGRGTENPAPKHPGFWRKPPVYHDFRPRRRLSR